MQDVKMLIQRIESLVIFKNLLKDKVVKNLLSVLKTKKISSYSKMISELYQSNGDLSQYLLQKILQDENQYMLKAAQKAEIEDVIKQTLDTELMSLNILSHLDSNEVIEFVQGGDFLPKWTVSEIDFTKEYYQRIKDISKTGYGSFAKYNTFVLQNKKITPILNPDRVSVVNFSGYAQEREKIVQNTKALVEGKFARNVLLYGDAGTGKSSSVKAIASMFADRGVRLIEVKKRNIYQLPKLIDSLASNPLKFIIFIDDLSFTTNDDNFTALKAILEGGASSINANIVVYATSNRRHLIKETFAERQGDDVHSSDTKEEMRSLSARFGLTVTFSRPDKDLYLSIVDDLAKEYNITLSSNELHIQAESSALRAGGRSPRTALQFIKGLASQEFD